MTNKEKYFPGCTLDDDTLAVRIACPIKIDHSLSTSCHTSKTCTDCTIDWLRAMNCKMKEEPQKPKVPALIDRPNFERQLESFSIKAFVQQFKYLACKVNEILQYLEERDEQID